MNDLHRATFVGSAEGTIALLSRGSINIGQGDPQGRTPLMYAARNETDGETLVRTLVAAGANLDKKNNRGRTGERRECLSSERYFV